MKKLFLIGILLIFSSSLFAQEKEFVLRTETGNIYGTMSVPKNTKKMPLVLFIGGSGPTDRDCNQPTLKTNAFKMLSDSLSHNGIASLRFDKRGIAASVAAGTKEEDLRFEHYIDDVKSWIDTLKTDLRFSEIIVMGHSEGSLIGMIACKNNSKVSKYISISGVAISADKIIKEQLANQPAMIKDAAFPILDSLKAGKTLSDVPQMLYSLFRPSVQPYMISWMKYNPQDEIKKLAIPILIIQGTTDIQVSESQADLLHSANKKSSLCKIENMNHVLKTCKTTEPSTQMTTYTNPDFPLADGLIKVIIDFVKK
jgi:hypothetical protein